MPIPIGTIVAIILVILVLLVIISNIVIVPQSKAYVVERLGAFRGVWNVGLHLKVPFIERVAKKVSLKEQVADFAPQPVITKDNVTMQIDTVIYFQITDPKLYTYGVDAGRITRERMCQLLSENPAKLYGMYPEKGVIAPGSDADIVVMRTGVEDTVTAADQVQNVDYAPFEGRKLTARIESVFLRGTQVVKDHQVVVEKAGRFVKRGKYAL